MADKEFSVGKNKTVKIDDFLSRRILERLGKDSGTVEVTAEEWDLGFCDTCSYLERGFAIKVDGKLVWPNDEMLANFGGYVYADDRGRVESGKLSSWGAFFDWLDGESLETVARQDDEDYDEYDYYEDQEAEEEE